MEVKEIWKPITDPAQQAAIKNGPKYRQYFEMHGDVMWLLMGVRDGKRL
jgi:putative component of toxin-antitoxin plasmid stabilization module